MFRKIFFWAKSKRIGPDIPLTHFLLHSKCLGRWLSKKKFYKFGEGSEFRVGAYAIATDKISIGSYVVIRPGTMLFASPASKEIQIVIDDYALIGSGVHVYVSNHEFSDKNKPIYFQGHSKIKKVHIKKGCWVGANVIILPGVTIGENSIVGAGSIVTKDVPERCIVAGNPARVIKVID